RYLVFAVLCVGFILAVCDAACFNQPPPNLQSGQKPLKGCLFEGSLHKFGSKWLTKECLDCSCASDGSVFCCTRLGLSIGFDESRCKYIEDKKACTWKLVSKEDPTKDC
ncbi:unnamed protein product, partial [Staurois parvus]